MNRRLLVLSGGTPPFVDPWHPLAATSARLAAVAEEAGFDVELSSDLAGRAADLTGVDVLVVNTPIAEEADDRSPAAAAEPEVAVAAAAALERFLARPTGVLGVHSGITGLLGLPTWHALMGARWVRGVTGHPPIGPCTLRGLDDPRVPARRIDLVDERYSDLVFGATVQPLVEHDHDGRTHPLVWAREVGAARVIADALGHDERSYDSELHRELLTRCLRWLARLDG
jgi:uncharacterized protein